MAQKHLFGQPLTVLFRPAADDESVSAYSLSSARIYDEYPSEAQIENTATGHIEEVVSWTVSGVNEYRVAFAALADDEPHSSNLYEKYFVVFNYRYASGGEVKFDVEQLFVYRPDSQTDVISASFDDVLKIESRLEDVAPYDASLWLADKIEIAKDEIYAELEARGYKRRLIFENQKLNLSAVRLAASLACSDVAAQGSQFWAEKAKSWKESADRMLEAAMIGIDVSGQDTPESPDQKKFMGAAYVAR